MSAIAAGTGGLVINGQCADDESGYTQLARIDGGSSFYTLVLDGANITLSLGAIANQGGSLNSRCACIESIKRIDLMGSGNNTLRIGIKDVLDVTSFNNSNGWVDDGTYNLATGGAGAPPPGRCG